MYIRRVKIRDVRGIKELDFSFVNTQDSCRGWYVVTGDNGSGKTTFLKAIALALIGPDRAHVLQESFHGWIREGQSENHFAVEIVAGEKDGFAKGRRYERPFWSELSCVSTVNGAGQSFTKLEIANELKGKGRGPAHGPWSDEPSGWFAAGYGPFRRLYGASPDGQRIMSAPPRVAGFATMFREDATLGECELWLKDLQHKTLEKKQREEQILDQVLRLLNDDFLRNGMTVDRVDSEGLWVRDANGVVLPLSNMSEGYRAALALLVDLLKHLVATYGAEQLIEIRDGRCVVPHSGVVLIDEMDSHLHPEWQRQIGEWLTRHFPELQFIVTTHSALICQAASEQGVYHLPPANSDITPFRLSLVDYWKLKKDPVDRILTSPAFGLEHTRSPEAVRKQRRFSEIRAKEAATKLTPAECLEKQALLPFMDETSAETLHATDSAV